MDRNYMIVAADAARHTAAELGVAVACPFCRRAVDAAEAKANGHMHDGCYKDYRIGELERQVEAQGIVINRIKRQIDGAWQGAA